MSKLSSSNHTVERLVTHLERSGLIKGLGLSDEDIADAIWLTLQMGVVEIETVEEQSNSLESEDQVIINEIEETPISDLDSSETNSTIEVYEREAINQDFEAEETPKGFPFQVPAAPAIQNKLPIGRALRPLMRKVSSSTRTIIDAEATVNRIAEQNIWLPVTKPEPERWLDLELVVEESRSSFIWTETVDELQQLLQNHGAFRTVRVWSFSSTDCRHLELTRRRKGNQKSHYKHSYRELIHSNKRGLILIVSDCTSNIWQQKNIYECLHKLSNKLPTAIMQLFPERLWQSSELGLGYKLQLSAFNPGVPNSKLVLSSLWEELETEQILKLPVVTIEAFSLGQWSKVLAGYGNTRTPGFVFELEFLKEQFTQQANERPINQQSTTDNSQEVSVEELAEEVVDRFLATASPTAQKLAGLMAAAPVSLAVVNLIRRQFLPYKSTPVNVAEVFLSGMIRRTNTSGNKTSDSEPQYDFIPGVRKLLNQATRLGETENVLDKLSEYIARELGLPSSTKTFSALLLQFQDLKQEEREQILPFAQIAVEVLQNLGGEYAVFADRVAPKMIDAAPPEIASETEDKEISEPEIKTCTFKAATVEVLETRTFEFVVATLERKSVFLGFGNRWVINRRKQQATGIVEVIKPGIELELMEIPAGTFTMGTPETEEGSRTSERPQHQVKLPCFFIGKYPITQAQWKAVVTLPKVNRYLDTDPSSFQGDNRPVDKVSWYDAVEFCVRLSNYTGREYRLPSEAEWEYACRAGTSTPFHFGETITSDLANYNAISTYGDGPKGIYLQETTPVGCFDLANGFGLYDMHGNVWEWCLDDWHDSYTGAPTDESAWMSKNNNFYQAKNGAVLRGGSWFSISNLCRSAYRYLNLRAEHDIIAGFRVVYAFGRALK